jgi:hypothetical protein
MTTLERWANATRSASLTSAVVHPVCKRTTSYPGGRAVFRLLACGAAADDRNGLQLAWGPLGGRVACRFGPIAKPIVRIGFAHSAAARLQLQLHLGATRVQKIRTPRACGCLFHRHNSARRASFGEHAARADVAIAGAIALRRMECLFAAPATRPGRGSGATELRQDKSRDVRPGRTAKERRKVSTEEQCAFFCRKVRFLKKHATSNHRAHCGKGPLDPSHDRVAPRAFRPFDGLALARIS